MRLEPLIAEQKINKERGHRTQQRKTKVPAGGKFINGVKKNAGFRRVPEAHRAVRYRRRIFWGVFPRDGVGKCSRLLTAGWEWDRKVRHLIDGMGRDGTGNVSRSGIGWRTRRGTQSGNRSEDRAEIGGERCREYGRSSQRHLPRLQRTATRLTCFWYCQHWPPPKDVRELGLLGLVLLEAPKQSRRQHPPPQLLCLRCACDSVRTASWVLVFLRFFVLYKNMYHTLYI